MKKRLLVLAASFAGLLGVSALMGATTSPAAVFADAAISESDGKGNDATNYWHTGNDGANTGEYSTEIHSSTSSRSLKFYFNASAHEKASGDIFLGDMNGWKAIDLTGGSIQYDIKFENALTSHEIALSDNNGVSGKEQISIEENGTGYTCTSLGDGWYRVKLELSQLSNISDYYKANAFRFRVIFYRESSTQSDPCTIYLDNVRFKKADADPKWTPTGGFDMTKLENFDTVTLSDVSGKDVLTGNIDYTTDSTSTFHPSENNTTHSVVYKFRQNLTYSNSGKSVNVRLRGEGWKGIEIWHTDNDYRSVQMRTCDYGEGIYSTLFGNYQDGMDVFESGVTYDVQVAAINLKDSEDIWVCYIVDDEILCQGTLDVSDSTYSKLDSYDGNRAALYCDKTLNPKFENATGMEIDDMQATASDDTVTFFQNDTSGTFLWLRNVLPEDQAYNTANYADFAPSNEDAYVKYNGNALTGVGVNNRDLFMNFKSNALEADDLQDNDLFEFNGSFFQQTSTGFRFVTIHDIKVVYYGGEFKMASYFDNHHDFKLVEGVEPSCQHDGHKAYYVCDYGHAPLYAEDAEGNVIIEDIDAWLAEGGAGYLPKSGHVFVLVNGVTPTCTEAGYKSYYACSEKDAYAEDAEGTTLIEDIAAWIKEGGAGYLAPIGHEYGAPTFEWYETEDGYTAKATFACIHNSEHTEKRFADVTSAVTKEATKKEEGVMRYTATITFNGKTYTDTKDVAIPMLASNGCGGSVVATGIGLFLGLAGCVTLVTIRKTKKEN